LGIRSVLNDSIPWLTSAAGLLKEVGMRPDAIRYGPGYLALAPAAESRRRRGPTDAATLPATTAGAMAQAASPQAIAEYRRKLREYQEARAAFEQEASAYWNSIAEKRRGRNAKRRDRQSHRAR